QVELPGVGTLPVSSTLWGGLCLAGLTIGLHAILAQRSAKLASSVLGAARHRALEAFSAAPWEVQSLQRDGALQETTSTLALHTAQLTHTLVTCVSASLNLAALLIVAACIDAVIMAIVLGAGLLLFAVLRPIGRLTRRRAR